VGRELARVVSRTPKTRNVVLEREDKERDHFVERHPLANLYRAILLMDAYRDDRNWENFAFYARDLCSSFANLDEETQAWFILNDLLPSPPAYLGVMSSLAWVAYLAALNAAGRRWQRLREGVRGRIVDGWGEDFLPTVSRPLPPWVGPEPPF
jgi:hypothetical protein